MESLVYNPAPKTCRPDVRRSRRPPAANGRIESGAATLHRQERIEALTMNLEPAFRDIESLKALAQNSRTLHDSIRGLASIARAHVQPI